MSAADDDSSGIGGIGNDDVAKNKVLLHLLKSGKISLDDAKAAILATSDNNCNGNDKQKSKKTSSKPKSQQQVEKYRTRHVALQFSYDGADFSGFAQNVGKEGDNSVERALFAALEKTRLLLQPEEHGMLIVNNNNAGDMDVDEKKTNLKSDSGSGVDDEKVIAKKDDDQTMSARTTAKYSRCGRTDKGVHANGQVVALYLKSAYPLSARLQPGGESANDGTTGTDSSYILGEDMLPKNSLVGLECLVPPKSKKFKGGGSNGSTKTQSAQLQRKTITEYDYPRILNNILPPSIRVLGWCPVSSEFSARFSCSQRTYRYFFPRRNLDLEAMAQGLQYMMGKHDFRNMCKMNCEQVYNFERTLMKGEVVSPQKIYTVSVEVEGIDANDTSTQQQVPSPHDMCHIEIVGQAFLWHQIRCIMSILFYIGRKLESPMIVHQLFDIKTNPAKPAYEMASETALVLQDCKFGHLNLGRTVRNLWNVTKVLEQRWENHAVATERASDALESVKNETEVRWTDVIEFVMNIARDRRRKERKRTNTATMGDDDDEIRQALEAKAPESAMITWGSAVQIIQDVLGIFPHSPTGTNQNQRGQTESSIHIPLMDRSKGTTYEEKVQSILGEGGRDTNGKSTKRKDRYEDNIIKKRKTSEEDKAFYEHMLRQGGSSV